MFLEQVVEAIPPCTSELVQSIVLPLGKAFDVGLDFVNGAVLFKQQPQVVKVLLGEK